MTRGELSERQLDIETLRLQKGSHEQNSERQMCVMEAVAYVAGEPWTDSPQCASQTITAFLVRWNDDLPDEDRQMLKPLIPLMVGTRSTPQIEARRAWMIVDWRVRVNLVAWLRLARMRYHADAIAGLDEICDAASAHSATPAIASAQEAAAAARDAAGDAARDAAGDAAAAALADTTRELQASAIALVHRMIEAQP